MLIEGGTLTNMVHLESNEKSWAYEKKLFLNYSNVQDLKWKNNEGWKSFWEAQNARI